MAVSVADTPKHADLIYDVGMHRGEDTEFYLRKGFRVVAFEADPGLILECKERFARHLRERQLHIIEGAIIDDAATSDQRRVAFFRNDQISVWGTCSTDWARRNERLMPGSTGEAIEVNKVDFVDALTTHGVPHYLKIDIEGNDMVCVNALRRFRERPDYLSIESNKIRFAELRREITALSALGYDAFQAIEQSEIPTSQSPPALPREGKYAPHVFEFGCSGLFGAELGDRWKSRSEILRLYRAIHIGYFLFGDDGMLNEWQFRGAFRLQSAARRIVRRLTGAAVPGWYDTHARLRGVGSAP